jgi:hypothetical protein
MGLWNTHGMGDDEEEIQEALSTLALTPGEMEALVEHTRRENWVWTRMARHEKGQKKRKANLIAKYWNLRMEKWIDLTATAEMEYEEEYGVFAIEEES